MSATSPTNAPLQSGATTAQLGGDAARGDETFASIQTTVASSTGMDELHDWVELSGPGGLGDELNVVLIADHIPPEVLAIDGPLPIYFLARTEVKEKEYSDVKAINVYEVACNSGKYWETPMEFLIRDEKEKREGKGIGEWYFPAIVGEEIARDYATLPEAPDDDSFFNVGINDEGDRVMIVGVKFFRRKEDHFKAMVKAQRVKAQKQLVDWSREHLKTDRTTQRIFEGFYAKVVEPNDWGSMGFDEVEKFVKRDDVTEVSRAMLGRLMMLCNYGRGGRPLISGTVNVKIILAAFMIVNKPNMVFENMDDLSNGVIDAGRDFIGKLKDVCKMVAEGESWRAASVKTDKKLPSLLCAYLCKFKTWKLQHEKRLANRLTKALQGLERAEAGLERSKSNEPIRAEIENQKARLREKLKTIAGEGALRAYDETRCMIPAVAVSTPSGGSGTGAQGRPVRGILGDGGGVGGMTNMQLAHELMVDSEFRLEDLDEMNEHDNDRMVRTKIRETFETVFWESLVEDIDNEVPSYVRVMSVLEEIRTSISQLSKGIPSADGRINGIINVEDIVDKLAAKKVTHAQLVPMVNEVMDIIEAIHTHQRDTKNKRKSGDEWIEVRMRMLGVQDRGDKDGKNVCEILRFMLNRIHAIRVKTANTKLMAIAPTIREHGVEYEKSRFQQALDGKEVTMDGVNVWINATLKEAEGFQAASAPFKVEDVKAGGAIAYEKVVKYGIVRLVTKFRADSGIELPATMLMDRIRIVSLHNFFRMDVLCATALTSAMVWINQRGYDLEKNRELLGFVQNVAVTSPPRNHFGLTAFAKRISNAISYCVTEEADLQQLVDKIEMDCALDAPLYKALFSSMRDVWFALLDKQDTDVVSRRLPMAARVIVDMIDKKMDTFRKMVRLNLRVHVDRYNGIVSRECAKVYGA